VGLFLDVFGVVGVVAVGFKHIFMLFISLVEDGRNFNERYGHE
jgi:hypothetical protein